MTGVKICGLSTPETLHAALHHGADYVGFVFFAKSPRNVTLAQAAALAAQATNQSKGQTKTVALVVNADNEQLAAINTQVKPDYFQLHGGETPARLAEIKNLTGKPAIKAISLSTAEDLHQIALFKQIADLLLFDAKVPAGLPGGNGQGFDWSLLAEQRGQRFMLAGGLTPENVGQALALTAAPLVDVSSGVETAPGQKHVELIRKFIEAAKAPR